ncbi:Solute carrier family 12 protein [Dirofilaria immitis]
MAQNRHIEITITAYSAFFIGFCISAICANASIINEENDEAGNENRKDWYATLLKSKPQFGFERDSRSHAKPTFIRFGKRDFDAYDPNLFNIK